MSQRISYIALLVNDYDEAIQFYTKKLNFDLVDDTKLSEEKRWVLVKPKGGECCLLLARAADDEQRKFIGNQSGGRVFLFLHTTTFDSDYQNLIANNVTIVRDTTSEAYGRVCVFADLYGNKWDLLESTNS
jgi:catechol 2,3-dioxygenase-like lactoylglutathione lyase family enzyme